MQCVILAGGLATRMRPLTEDLPKALLPVGGQPFLHYQLTHLAAQGVTSVVMCIGYRGHQIQDYAGTGERWGLELTYADEGEDLKGTGGALRIAFDEGLLQGRFLLTYGDSFLTTDHSAFWKAAEKSTKPAFMSIFRNQGQWDRSNVSLQSGLPFLYDKKQRQTQRRFEYIDYGLLALRRELIASHIPPGLKVDLADVLYDLCLAGEMDGLEVRERFYEVGSPEGLRDFEAYIVAMNGRCC